MYAIRSYYVATSPKSNSAYEAINKALQTVQRTGDLSVPLHIRNAPTKLMKELGYGKEYKYAHAYEGNFAEQDFLPEEVRKERFYIPQNNASELKIVITSYSIHYTKLYEISLSPLRAVSTAIRWRCTAH